LSFSLSFLLGFEFGFLFSLLLGGSVNLDHLFDLLRSSDSLGNLSWSSSFRDLRLSLFHLESFFSLLLLLNLQHLQLSLSLSSLQLMLSLQPSKVSFGRCFLSCSLFGLLNGLSGKELLLLLLSL
jgi:hypothetical protein